LITMKSMEYDDSDKLDAVMPIPMPDKPDFPFGLRICLTEKELEKLGLDHTEAEVGGMVHGHFMANITSVSAEQRDGNDTCRVELQIQALSIEAEEEGE
jgi:hypothetical protein